MLEERTRAMEYESALREGTGPFFRITGRVEAIASRLEAIALYLS